jgi:hypothetical protein
MLGLMYMFVVPLLQKPWLQTTNSGGLIDIAKQVLE